MSYYGSYRLGQAGGEFTHTHAHEKFVTSYILGPLGIVVKIEFKVNGEETGDGHCVTVGFIQVGLPPRLTIFNTKCQHSCINLHHRR
jgi:hypothetical protein